jgi:hypothetical protein
MTCPTCEFDMLLIAAGWSRCPRCGTLTSESGGAVAVEVPKLVGYCRAFEDELADCLQTPVGPDLARVWKSTGVAESIRPNRPREK